MTKVLAISGGVDSIFLAYQYREKDIVLAFVNYNIRKDTHIDEKIVDSFAQKYNLKLEKLILDGTFPKNENFENWARNIRYDFFKKIYDKYNCNELLIAHHKDDFLETCIMQERKNKNKLFYGIKQKITLRNMKINRPLLFKYWKNDIYYFAKIFNLEYNDDYTNFDDCFERNKIRRKISENYTLEEKEKLFNYFLKINEFNKPKINLIQDEYYQWSENNFSPKYFENLDCKEEIIKLFINKRLKDINLNQNIIKNIIAFILSNNFDKQYLLSGDNYIAKTKNKVYIKKIRNNTI